VYDKSHFTAVLADAKGYLSGLLVSEDRGLFIAGMFLFDVSGCVALSKKQVCVTTVHS
jgi:hypothetical protein